MLKTGKIKKKEWGVLTLLGWSVISLLVGGIIFYVSVQYMHLSEISELSNLSDVMNTILGLPIAIVGTFLAFYLALTAYNLSKREIDRDSRILFDDKYERSIKLFLSISMRISRLLYFSDIPVTHFHLMYSNVWHAEDDKNQLEGMADKYIIEDHKDKINEINLKLQRDFSEFYTNVRGELNRVGFMDELKHLEGDFMELLADRASSQMFLESENISYSIPDTITAIRGWGDIAQGLDTKDKGGGCINSRLGFELFNFLNQASYARAFSDRAKGEEKITLDSKRFSYIFFGSLLNVREYTETNSSEITDKYIAAHSDIEHRQLGDELTYKEKIDILRNEVGEDEGWLHGETLFGIQMLSVVMSAIPSASKIAEALRALTQLSSIDVRSHVKFSSCPSEILKNECGELKNIIENNRHADESVYDDNDALDQYRAHDITKVNHSLGIGPRGQAMQTIKGIFKNGL